MMVLRETPVAAATAVTPPRPSTLASTATSRRPWRTSSAARITPHRRAIGEASVMPRSLNGHVQMNYLFFNEPYAVESPARKSRSQELAHRAKRPITSRGGTATR